MENKKVMQIALECLLEFKNECDEYRWSKKNNDCIETLQTALAQLEPAECDGGQCGIGGYCKQCPKTQSEQKPVAWEALVESVRQMRDVQGIDGNWNCHSYIHGLFNGIEFALSLIEVREPKFRDAPKKWLCDQPKAQIFSGEKTHG